MFNSIHQKLKLFYFILFTFLQNTLLFGQNQYMTMPYKYNSFINKPDISWACEMYSIHSFSEPVNVHEYLIDCQKKGTIKSYVTKDYLDEKIKWVKRKIDDYYFEIDNGYIFEQLESYKDTTDEVEFHEIFCIENRKLKSIIITAAPQLKVYTSLGLFIGNTGTSYSSLNYYLEQKQNKKDSIIYLGNTYSVLNFDSIEKGAGLKKTYGMALSLTLWNDLSHGFNNVIDLKTNSIIPRQDVMEYSPFDSIEQKILIDSMPDIVTYKMKAAPAYRYFSDIGISQDWYYNKTKNIFFTDIKKAYLYINYWDQKTMKNVNEKRFGIDFK